MSALAHPTEPVSHRDAREVLAARGIRPQRICRVDSDAVLYISPGGRPRTAWLKASPAGVKVHDAPGWEPWPPEHAFQIVAGHKQPSLEESIESQ